MTGTTKRELREALRDLETRIAEFFAAPDRVGDDVGDDPWTLADCRRMAFEHQARHGGVVRKLVVR